MAVKILQGDVREQLRTLPDASVQVVCTSPPYFRLRSYLPADHPAKALEIGQEQTPAAFVAGLVTVFEEVKRVLRPDGVLFVNLADSYAGSGKGPTTSTSTLSGGRGVKGHEKVVTRTAQVRQGFINDPVTVEGIRPKSLFLIPQRFAIAMQEAGWIVRDEIVWAKKSAMPESVRDRCTKAWEPIFMFVKQGRYYWDQEAVRVPLASAPHAPGNTPALGEVKRQDFGTERMTAIWGNAAGANLRNVWHLSPEPSREAHYASFPTEIPRRCILAATSERGQCPACGSPWVRLVERTPPPDMGRGGQAWTAGATSAPQRDNKGGLRPVPPKTHGWAPSCQCQDAGEPVPQTVLDPFLGTGTTLLVASRLGRNGVGIDLNPEYVAIAERRIRGDAPLFADVDVLAAHEPAQLTLEEAV